MMAATGRTSTRATCRAHFVGVLALAALVLVPIPARAQVAASSLGFVGGVVAGAHTAMGLYVLRSRITGWNFHSVDEIVSPRLETMPILVLPITGAVLGARSPDRLGAAATWGGVGIVCGAAIGATAGHLIWGDTQGRWAGGTIGSAAGLLVGSILGAALKGEDAEETGSAARPRYITFSIPVGGF